MLQDGTTVLSPVLGASGIHVIGELPAGTELPLLGMPNGQIAPDLSALAGSGLFPTLTTGALGSGNSSVVPGTTNMYGNQAGAAFQSLPNSGPVNSQST